MTRTRKFITASIAALTLAGAVSATTTPAAAWGKYHHHHGGWGWGPGVALGIGALTVGALAASSAYDYDTCVVRQRVYDDWGRFRGYRRVRVAC